LIRRLNAMNKVVHFEIPTSDLRKAQDFYSAVFGWQMMPFDADNVMTSTTEVDDNFMPKEPGAINGGIYKASGHTPHVVVDVPDIQAHIELIKQHGGSLVTEVETVPNMGMYCRCKDPEGNMVGLWQNL
jgi:predicted enzyme related to lactoylglutathione lyase